MSATISDGATTITPESVHGFESKRPSRNVVHNIIESAENAVTLRPAGLRTGTLSAMFLTLPEALELEAMVSQDKVFTFALAGLTGGSMSFVADGDIATRQDPATKAAWLVAVDFQEVTP